MLGSRIAALRKEMGWSQAALAARLGVSASAVGMYEQGRREPSNELLISLSGIFGVSVDYLLTGQEVRDRSCRTLPRLSALAREELLLLLATQLKEER